MISICFVPCNNGLGHIRRMAFLANKISNQNMKIFFFIEKKKQKKFKLNKNINKIYFKTNSLNYLSKIFQNRFLKTSDIIVSDNLIHKKFILKKTVLFANFLWEEILKINKKNLKILKNKNIKIFSNYLFSNIKSKVNIKKVGFFDQYRSLKKSNAILIGTGSARSKLLKKFKKDITKIIKNNGFKKKKIYLDPSIYSEKLKKYSVFEASYSDKMYSQISFAMIKPGLGTIEECLKRGIPIIPVMGDENNEFKFNTKILKKKKLGFVFENPVEGVNFINKNFNNIIFLNKYKKRCKNLRWNGEKNLLIDLNKLTY